MDFDRTHHQLTRLGWRLVDNNGSSVAYERCRALRQPTRAYTCPDSEMLTFHVTGDGRVNVRKPVHYSPTYGPTTWTYKASAPVRALTQLTRDAIVREGRTWHVVAVKHDGPPSTPADFYKRHELAGTDAGD